MYGHTESTSFLGLPVLKHVLTPRIKATHVAFDSMKNYLDAIYDVTVAFEGTVDDKGQRKEAPSMAGELVLSELYVYPGRVYFFKKVGVFYYITLIWFPSIYTCISHIFFINL